MAYLGQQLKFILIYPEGSFEAKLADSSISFKKTKDKTYGYTIRKITDVKFYNDANRTFDRLKAIDMDPTTCTRVIMQVYSINNAGAETLRQIYDLPNGIGSFDDDDCQVSIEPRLTHDLKCLVDKAKTEVNLLRHVDKQEISFVQGEIQTHVCTLQAPSNPDTWILSSPIRATCDGISAAEGWTLVHNQVNGVSLVDDSFGFVKVYRAELVTTTTYRREFLADTVSPGADWIAVDGGFARPLITRSDLANSKPLGDGNQIIEAWTVAGVNTETGAVESIDNGITLQSAIEYYTGECNLTLVSDFFGINGDDTAPNNIAYNYASEYLQLILVFQASDVIRASAISNATILNMTFEKLWLNLKRFNIEIVKSPTGVVRIEHVSYRRYNKHFDLMTQYEVIKGGAKYTSVPADAPRFELFKDKYSTGGSDFDNASIEYDALCSSDSPDDQEKTITSPNTVCNLRYLFDNPDLYEELDKMEDTIVMVSTTASGTIDVSIGGLSGEPTINAALSWANLIQALWLWDRPQYSGLVNGTHTIFESTLPRKKQDKLTVKVCSEDFWTEYQEDDLAKAHYGWSQIEDSTYKLPDELLEISLKF